MNILKNKNKDPLMKVSEVGCTDWLAAEMQESANETNNFC